VDSVISFSVGIGSPIVLTPANGGAAVNLAVPTPNRVELSHLAAKVEPLAIVNVPQGNYSTLTITMLAPTVQIAGNPRNSNVFNGQNQTVTVNLNPAITIGSNPAILDIDVSASQSLTVNPSSGIVNGINFTPTSFKITAGPVAAQALQQDNDGELEDESGMVSNVSGNSFNLSAGQSGAQLTYATDNTTLFDLPLTGLSSTLNQLVRVEGYTRSDGSLFATEVEPLGSDTGSEMQGWVVGVIVDPSGNVTSLLLATQDGNGNGMSTSMVGNGFTVDVSSLPPNKVDIARGRVDTSGLVVPGPNFPFDLSSLRGGQRVEVASANPLPVPGATLVANRLKLKQQTVGGQVTAINGTSIPRTIVISLAPDSAARIDSHTTNATLTVYEQPGTDDQLSLISIGDTIRVRGLMFNASGNLNIIARRITGP